MQISSNKKFVSIQFNTSTMMETFCTEPLKIQDYSVQFKPDFLKRSRVYIEYHYISFLNVPSEADEDAMTDFVKQFATVVGNPRYPQKSLHGIHYMTGTRVYRLHSIQEHIPRVIDLFGRKIKCIYTSQPEYQDFIQRQKTERNNTQYPESDIENIENNNADNTNKTENNNQPQQQNQNPSENDIPQNTQNENMDNNNEESANQPQVLNPNNNNQNEQTNKQSKSKKQVNNHLQQNYTNITQRKRRKNKTEDDKSPPTFNNENYPPLTENTTENNTDKSPTIIEETPIQQQPTPDKTVIEETPIFQLPSSTDENIEFLSPPMVSTTAISTSTPETIDTSTPTIDHSTIQMQTNPRYSYNKEILHPKIYNKKGKIISQEKIQDTALKMT